MTKPHTRLFPLLTLLLTLLVAGPALADGTFTQVNWHTLHIDSVLPVYSEVVPLETDFRLYDYDVAIEYPEWQQASSKESEAIRTRYVNMVSDTLDIRTHVGVSRKRGLLDVSFVPIVFRDGKYQKLTSFKMSITPRPKASRRQVPSRNNAENSQQYAEHSVLASGRWVKVSVKKDGIYLLSDRTLADMGFSNPANCQVYGYGGHLQDEVVTAYSHYDDLQPTAVLHTEQGLLFHANGLEKWSKGHHVPNHYAREAYYFVTEGDAPATDIETVDAAREGYNSTMPTSYQAYTAYNPQEYSWFQGGRMFFESYDYSAGNSRSYKLTIPSHLSSEPEGIFNFSFSSSARTTLTPTVNGTIVNTYTISDPADEYAKANLLTRNNIRLGTDILKENTIRFTTDQGVHAHLNYFELSYRGLLKLDSEVPYIEVYKDDMMNASMPIITVEYEDGQDVQIWELERPGTPAVSLKGSKSEQTDDNGKVHHYVTVVLPDPTGTHRYAIFDAAAKSYEEPVVASSVENQDLHALDSIDMVILTPASGMMDAQAERLAEAHRAYDGLRIAVLRADKVYNEFSSGTPDATAYRRLLKMLYDRADEDTAPRYLLLFGDCAWDNRMVTTAWRNYKPDNYLLCFESQNSVSDTRCYVMEDYFGLLDDGEGSELTSDKTDIGVGRFPVRTVAQATALVDKTINYIEGAQAGAWKNVVCFMGDDGDNNEHMSHADSVAVQVERDYPDLEVRKIMWDAYQRETTASGNRYPQVTQLIQEQMAEGAVMMNYTGHASYYCISHEMTLRIADFVGFNTPRPPLWVTAACDVMPFDTQTENIGETALLHKTGAAIGFFGTTRTVYATNNLRMNQAFCQFIFATDEQGRSNRLGDAVRLAKCVMAADTREGANAENKLHYALLGDPALRLGSITNKVVLDSINGIQISQLPSGFTLHAGGKARLSGHLEDYYGNPLTGFEGTLHARLYDSKNDIICYNNTRATTAFTFSAFDKILYNGTDSVTAGRFTITCPIPIDINYSDDFGRVLFYALSGDKLTEANGHNEAFRIGGTEPDLTDQVGPVITAYLNSPDFTDGSVVNATPYFIAELQDESGINASGNGMGHDLELIIDNSVATTYTLNDYYTSEFGDYTRGTVAFSIPTLKAGKHSLLFRAWDNLNNYATTTLTFEVDPALGSSILNLSASNSPASQSTTFLLSYDRPGSVCQFTIEVFDFVGRLLWSYTTEGSSPNGLYAVPWNLCTGSGMPLGSGVYLYRARIKCDDSSETTKSQKIIINRRK